MKLGWIRGHIYSVYSQVGRLIIDSEPRFNYHGNLYRANWDYYTVNVAGHQLFEDIGDGEGDDDDDDDFGGTYNEGLNVIPLVVARGKRQLLIFADNTKHAKAMSVWLAPGYSRFLPVKSQLNVDALISKLMDGINLDFVVTRLRGNYKAEGTTLSKVAFWGHDIQRSEIFKQYEGEIKFYDVGFGLLNDYKEILSINSYGAIHVNIRRDSDVDYVHRVITVLNENGLII